MTDSPRDRRDAESGGPGGLNPALGVFDRDTVPGHGRAPLQRQKIGLRMGLVMSEFLSLDDKIKKTRQAGCLMNRLKMAFGTTGDDPDPEAPMQCFKNFRNARE